MFYCYVKHKTGEKETRERRGKGLIKASFLSFVLIITIVFKVAGADIICLS